MRDHFVLLGPGKQKKGGKEPQETVKENVNQTEVDLMRDDQPLPKLLEDVARKILVTYPHDKDLLYKAKGRYIKDPMFQKILDSLRAYKNFIVSNNGMIRLRLYNQTVLCVPNIRVDGQRLQEMIVDQAHSLLAHLGAHKTLSYLQEFIWWTFARDVEAFCASCKTCLRSKLSNQKPYGLLNPLSIPTNPWEAIGIDFMGPLSVSKNRNGEYDLITVIIDLLTAMVHLAPS